MAKKKLALRVPKSVGELIEFIRYIGINQRKLEAIQTKLNERIEQLKAQATADGLQLQEEIDRLFEGIFIFAQKHRDKLTEKGEKKTVHFSTGDILWRMMPLAVSIASRNVKKVIEACKSSGLKRFIRIKEELNKEAMLREREVAEKIWGVNIGQKEQFVVKPAEVVEIAKDVEKLKRVLK